MPRIIHQSVTLPRQSTLHIARITLHSVMLEWRIGCNAECWTSVTLLAPCQVVLVSLLMNTNEHDAAVLGWKTPASNLLSPVTPLAPLPLPHWSLIKHAAGATCHVTCHEGCMMSTHWGRMGGKLTKHSSLFLPVRVCVEVFVRPCNGGWRWGHARTQPYVSWHLLSSLPPPLKVRALLDSVPHPCFHWDKNDNGADNYDS